MDTARYLPATNVHAGNFWVGRLTVRTSDDRELGQLVGFVVDDRHIRSLVVEADQSRLEVPMAPMQLDAATQSLRIVHDEEAADRPRAFSADSIPQVDDDDLWIPLFRNTFHTAA